MPDIQDQMGRSLSLPGPPRRMISLVPSLTELLFDLGLEEEVVGVTEYCLYPEEQVARLPTIGGPKAFDFQRITELQPDLLVGVKEENYREGILRLAQDFPVWMGDVNNVEDALEMIRLLGEILGRGKRAQRLAAAIKTSLDSLPPGPGWKTAYLIWKDPWRAAGRGTMIADLLLRCGLKNLFADHGRYPVLEEEQLADAELILLSSEPFPFSIQEKEELEDRFPQARVGLVDGTMFSWYGSRLQYFADYWENLRHTLSTAGFKTNK